MTVWIAMRGEYMEGGSVTGVFTSEADAVASVPLSVEEATKDEDGTHYWSDYRDWYSVRPHQVQ